MVVVIFFLHRLECKSFRLSPKIEPVYHVIILSYHLHFSSVSISLSSITRQMPRPRHKNKAIIRVSSHPSFQSLCLDSKLVIVVVVTGFKLQLHNAIYWLRFYSNSLTDILLLSNLHKNVASIQKNRGDKSHLVIVALSLVSIRPAFH